MMFRSQTAALLRGALVACALTLPATASAAPGDWASFGLPAGQRAESIAAGPNDLVYTAEGPAASPGRVSLDGTLTPIVLATPAESFAVAVTGDGSAWIGGLFNSQLIRVAPGATTGTQENGVFAGDGEPIYATSGTDDSVWLADTRNRRLIHIAANGERTVNDAVLRGRPMGMAAGPDGNLWVADMGLNLIARITPAGAVTEFPIGAGVQPTDITVGSDGALWFSTFEGWVGRITTSGDITRVTEGKSAFGAQGSIVTGPDGALWVPDKNGGVARITTAGDISYARPAAGQTVVPYRLAVGPDGKLWGTQYSPGAVVQLDTGAQSPVQQAPEVTGDPTVGSSLSCGEQRFADWAGGARVTSVEWLRDGTPIPGAAAFTYSPPAEDVGHELRCRVHARFDLQEVAVTTTSLPVGVTLPPTPTPTPSPTPSPTPAVATPKPTATPSPATKLTLKASATKLTVKRRKQAVALQLSLPAKLAFKAAPIKRGKVGKARALGKAQAAKAGAIKPQVDFRPLARGVYRVTVTATDAAGRRATATLRVTVR